MSKKLNRAVAEGYVEVRNVTSGEVQVIFRSAEGQRRTLLVPPFGKSEIAPRYTTPLMLLKGTNLPTLLRKSLRVVTKS